MPGQGLLGDVLSSGNSTVVNDVTSRTERSRAELKWTERTAIMAYPLFAESQIIGLMVLVRYRRAFDAEQFRVVGIIASQVGVTLHNAQIYERSLQRAEIDQNLDVLNHAAFMQKAQRAMGRAQLAGRPVALLLGDIDDFGQVNNTYGHATGDIVLMDVANLMKQAVPEPGFVGRRGGEEFVILLPDTNELAALAKAEEVRTRIQNHEFRADDGREVRATISTGVALFPRDASDIVSLDKFADRAAYLAKRMGKNRVCLYEDQKEKLELAIDLPVPPSRPKQVQNPPLPTATLTEESVT
jgi:diguanylate cyclase (GGDEF)-like protein